jgi:hypothetical protein
MEMPYRLYITIPLLTLSLGAIGYLGFLLNTIYLWKIYPQSNRSEAYAKLVVMGVALGFSTFISLGMILPSLSYPR